MDCGRIGIFVRPTEVICSNLRHSTGVLAPGRLPGVVKSWRPSSAEVAKPELIPLDWVCALRTALGTDNKLVFGDAEEITGSLEDIDGGLVIRGGGGGGGGGVHTDGVLREAFLWEESNMIPA